MQRIKNDMEILTKAICLQVIPVSLILLFAYTGTSKLLGHALFFRQLSEISFLGNFAGFISYFIPGIEIIVCLLLIFNSLRMIGLIVSSLLLAFFTAYIIFILSADHFPCSCGGVLSVMSWTQHLYFNIAFLIFSLTSFFYNKFLHVYKGVSRKPLE